MTILRRPWIRPSIEYAPPPISESEAHNAAIKTLVASPDWETEEKTMISKVTVAEQTDVNSPSTIRIANPTAPHEKIPGASVID
jgi:hypothetical protein